MAPMQTKSDPVSFALNEDIVKLSEFQLRALRKLVKRARKNARDNVGRQALADQAIEIIDFSLSLQSALRKRRRESASETKRKTKEARQKAIRERREQRLQERLDGVEPRTWRIAMLWQGDKEIPTAIPLGMHNDQRVRIHWECEARSADEAIALFKAYQEERDSESGLE